MDSNDSDISSASDSDSDGDLELLQQMEDEDILMLTQLLSIIGSCQEFVAPNEMSNQGTVDHTIGPRDTLGAMLSTPWFFKTLTNFEVHEWRELCELVVPTITANARTTGTAHILMGRPYKLTPEQCLMNFLLYMKHDNTIQYDAFTWNWAQSAVCDDSIFIASCICEAIKDEIRWPSPAERKVLAVRIEEFEGCVGFIDGTLVRIRKPKIPQHGVFFNGRKKVYSVNNTVIVDHNGLFVHLDLGYPGSFHDVNILRNSAFHRSWRQYFTTGEEDYIEYLLGDPGYVGEEQYIMRRIGNQEIRDDMDLNALNAYNRMHVGHRIAMEWGIGGLKQKWRHLMKRFDNTRGKYTQLIYACALLTNFLQRRRHVLSCEDLGEPHRREEDYGWAGDY